MAISWTTPVRVVQIIVAIIVLGVAGYLVSLTDHGYFNDSRPAFNVFTGLWTILVCAFLLVVDLAMSESFLANPIIVLALDGLTWIFWLSAFACMADILSYLPICDLEPVCGCLKADVAFGVINWLLFTATLIWTGISGFRGSKSVGGTQGV